MDQQMSYVKVIQYMLIQFTYFDISIENYTTMLSYIFSFSASDHPWPTYPSAIHSGVAGVGGPVRAAVGAV